MTTTMTPAVTRDSSDGDGDGYGDGNFGRGGSGNSKDAPVRKRVDWQRQAG